MGNSQLVTIEALTITEQSELAQHEAVIQRGLNTFVEVGAALLAIRDGKLYRAEFRTFEDYCRDRWGWARNYADKLIRAAETVNNLGTIVPVLPMTETQARPLTSLDPDQQREAWAIAVQTAPDGKVTASHVERVVNEIKADTKMAVHFSSDTPEWYTPPQIIERTLKVLGKIDLDPCSNSKTNPNVKAKKHYTVEDDGLSQKWSGRVYMNPPYGREIEDWITKLCKSHESGDVTEAIALVPARVDTQWWSKLRNYPVCFVSGRLKFGDAENSAPFPSAVVYLGNEIDKFYYAFCDLGDIWQRIEPGMFGE